MNPCLKLEPFESTVTSQNHGQTRKKIHIYRRQQGNLPSQNVFWVKGGKKSPPCEIITR